MPELRLSSGAGDGNRTRMTSLEGFEYRHTIQPFGRSAHLRWGSRLTVSYRDSLSLRARSGHATDLWLWSPVCAAVNP